MSTDISADLPQTLQTTIGTELSSPSLTTPFSRFLSSVKGSTFQLAAQARHWDSPLPSLSLLLSHLSSSYSVLLILPPENLHLPLHSGSHYLAQGSLQHTTWSHGLFSNPLLIPPSLFNQSSFKTAADYILTLFRNFNVPHSLMTNSVP